MPREILTAEEERLNLTESVTLANDYSGPEVSWKNKRYGPDEAIQFRRMLHAWRNWIDRGSHDIREMKLDASDRAALERYYKQTHSHIELDGTHTVNDDPSPWNEALRQFRHLLINRRSGFLGGPCRNRKKHQDQDHYYVRRTLRPSVFCSRQCASDAATATDRDNKRKNKLKKARKAIANYPKRPARFSDLGWKEYVNKAEPSISKRFLTMALRDGDLKEPQGGSHARQQR